MFGFNRMTAVIGAAALTLSLPATAVAQSDGTAEDSAVLADARGAAPVLGLLGLLGLVFLMMAISDGEDDDVPTSP